jgi:hypothetical protein
VIGWRGWNLVDYREAPRRPSGLVPVDRSDYWDQVIGEYSGGLAMGGQGNFIPCPGLTLRLSDEGIRNGSWQIRGIFDQRNRKIKEAFDRYGISGQFVEERRSGSQFAQDFKRAKRL